MTQVLRESGELPLDQYAAVGDGRSVALVGADGSIDWWCVPNLDSPPLFDRLLDPADGGRFSITPVADFSVQRRYRENSNVLEHIYVTASGSARITDSLNSGISGRLPWSELARRVEGLQGTVEFAVELRPGRRLERASPWHESNQYGDVLHIDGVIAALRADSGFEKTAQDDRHTVGRLVTRAGSRDVLAVLASADEPLILPALSDIDRRIDRSDQSWAEWCGNLHVAGPYASAIRRSALALKILLFSPSGAIAAAATSSLPERIGGDKNYEYRYAWVRDVAFTIKAFLRIGATEEAKAAFSWLTATIRRHGGHLQAMYQLDGALTPPAAELDQPGYRDSRPVTAGNRARLQVQLGMFGDVLEAAALFVEQGHVLDLVTRRLLADLTDQCADTWRQKDSGMWELPRLEHYTMSRMECWTALDRAVKLAQQGQIETTHAARWQRERDQVRDWIDTHCWSTARQAYMMFPGADQLDAAVLLATRLGFERTDRLALTRDAIVGELAHGPLVYRYSGMQQQEGTFTACGFWLVEAYALLGEAAAAVRQMDAMLGASGANLGLLNEQIDAGSGAMLGNMPQALSHLALIHAALAIDGT